MTMKMRYSVLSETECMIARHGLNRMRKLVHSRNTGIKKITTKYKAECHYLICEEVK